MASRSAPRCAAAQSATGDIGSISTSPMVDSSAPRAGQAKRANGRFKATSCACRLIRSESGTSKAGQWSVQGDQLCLLKPEISSTQAACFSVHRRGNELQYLDGQQLVYQGFLKRSS